MKFSWNFTVYLIFIISFELCAKTNNSIEVISAPQGVPNSRVNKIIKEADGGLWVGTAKGLCFYDGYDFSIFQSVPFDTSTLADDNILDIVQSSSQSIWLLTQYGVERLNSESGSVNRIMQLTDVSNVIGLVSNFSSEYVYLLYKEKVLRINAFSCNDDVVCQLNDNDIVMAGELIDKHLYLLTSNKLLRINTNTLSKEEFELPKALDTKTKVKLLAWADNKLIYSYKGDVFLYEPRKNKTKKIISVSGNILDLSCSSNKVLSIITLHKVYQLKINEQDIGVEKEEVFNSGADENISVLQDENDIIWVSTSNGVIKLNSHGRKIHHEKLPTKYLTPVNINSVVFATSKDGYLFKNSKGVINYNNTVSRKQHPISLENYNVFTCVDNRDVYFGSDSGLKRISIKKDKQYENDFLDNYLIHSIREKEGVLWVSTSGGLFKGDGEHFEHICDLEFEDFIVYDDKIYFSSKQGFGVLEISACTNKILLPINYNQEYLKVYDMLQSFDLKIWVATNNGLYMIDPKRHNDELLKESSVVYKGAVFSLIEAKKLPEVWFASDLGIGVINYRTQKLMQFSYEDGVEQTSFLPKGAYFGPEERINFVTNSEIISFSPKEIIRSENIPTVKVSKMTMIEENRKIDKFMFESDTIILPSEVRILKLSFSTFDFFAPLQTSFEYSLTSPTKPDAWTKMHGNVLLIGGRAPGVYSLKVRVKNSHGIESKQPKVITVVVKSPIYLSKLAILLYGVMLVLVVISLSQLRTRNLSRINREYKEKERIAKKIEQQKEELTLKNKNITDSINYARRIQLAMMPSIKIFHSLFPDSFILHMPKDIVSGDFYWVNKVDDKIFFSAVDCTGHGVPGAFMSIIGVELFRRITEIEKIYTPAEVLNSLSKNFERVFGDVDEMKLRDGMDLAFCSLNKEQTVLEYSGAFNPLYIVRDSSIIEIKGDRHSVGVYEDEDEVRPFRNHIVPLKDGDLIYIFTDGYVDQFGGPEGKKYKYRRFRHLLLALHQLPMSKQIDYLRKSILEWKGNQEQVDDILVMGLRVNQKR